MRRALRNLGQSLEVICQGSGSQKSNASNGVQFEVETKKLQPLQANHSELKKHFAKCCEITLLLRSDFAAFLYSKVFLLLTMPDLCREKEARNLKVEANFVALRHPLVISCEFVKGSPRLKIILNGINFVDHSSSKEHQLDTNQLIHQLGMNQLASLPGTECQILVVYAKWIRDSGGRLVKCDTPQRGEFEVILNIMEATPEDQHSHQGRQDNLNEFRSMRDRMHPPRMSAPSCIVPPTEQLVIRPYLVPLLPTFHGMESENPYAHIKEFEDVCNTFQEGGASIDLMRLKLFPFTLKDKAKIWLNSLRPRSIRSWTDLQAEFLKKFFPTHRTNGLKRQISNFSAKENEKFYECWERYMEAINVCPHHGFDTWLLVSYFYDGMSSSMKQLLETMCGGDFMSKNPEEAMDFLSYVADVSRGWDEPTKGEVGKMKSQLNAYNAKAGMYNLKKMMT
ncbi:hypothetical protein CK203_058420 [Vitis vinifera]|uniref:Retrotransposon gag domain-containing protein n=1 Tax=Vitis vinifera TaxID=29760 RepID=A0A438GI64_VITVI|nr:hypothetical protein CK203_058420 [Vitis vinifera]